MEIKPNCRLYVSNLHFNTTPLQLQDWFYENGFDVVDTYVPKDKNYQNRWKNRGFAFVELASEDQVDEAIESINDTVGPMGRPITLQVADKERQRGRY